MKPISLCIYRVLQKDSHLLKVSKSIISPNYQSIICQLSLFFAVAPRYSTLYSYVVLPKKSNVFCLPLLNRTYTYVASQNAVNK